MLHWCIVYVAVAIESKEIDSSMKILYGIRQVAIHTLVHYVHPANCTG